MLRAKKLVLLSHCLLNVNAKVEGLANYSGAQEELISYLVQKGFGMIQLPCPEMGCGGARRWGQTRQQLDTPFFRDYCQKIFRPIMHQVIDYISNGYEIVALIGINSSPSCGVNITCSAASWGGELHNWSSIESITQELELIPYPGVFMEQIIISLEVKDIKIPLLAVDEADPASSLSEIKLFLEGEV